MPAADTSRFEEEASQQGYAIFQRVLAPLEGLGDHEHDFDVWGLVTKGEFHITCEGATRIYREGEEFKLKAGEAHSDAAGPQGVTFVVGRRQR